MYNSPEFVRQRQQAVFDSAAEQRIAQRLRRLSKVTRRAERVELELSRRWSEAAQLRAEVSRLAADSRL